MSARIEPVTGQYLHLDYEGRHYRIYFESAGPTASEGGIPLVCLHTAGADGRQYRGLMNAASVTDRFRVIAFDLPWHGKSSPPEGWQDEEYRLTSDSYTGITMAVIAALGLERPVVMGCSIGGRVVLHLAVRHPTAFRALIGLESASHTSPYYDLDWLHRGDVHGGEVAAGAVSGLMAPQSPAADRWETLWHYMQSGPGVFKGDLYFYGIDGDIRSRLHEIDTARTPLYLLSGEYDYSATTDDMLAVAKAVPGAKATVMRRLGHFPTSENPELFLSYIEPVLAEIAAKG
ncbi:MAG TPA: alpha/beta hydrolase [Stellaceae bacterium]|jgi:pimeloyl-ACP methyl ester carboxylesterase|nr:alpha/beta hydrolase [Stellaceae bacterium]